MASRLVLLCVLLYLNTAQGQLKTLAKGEEVQLRFMESNVHIGQLPAKYLPLTTDDLLAGINLASLLENVRFVFNTGGQGLPPLDPYKLKALSPIPINTNMASGQVVLNNIVLSGLKQYQVKNFEVRLNNSRVDFNMAVPFITVEADYEVDLIISSFLPYSVAGHASIQISNLELAGGLGIQEFPFRRTTVFQLTALNVTVRSDYIALKVTGLDADEVIDLLDSTGVDDKNLLVSFLDHQVVDTVAKITAKYVNDFLRNYPKDVILTLLSAIQ